MRIGDTTYFVQILKVIGEVSPYGLAHKADNINWLTTFSQFVVEG